MKLKYLLVCLLFVSLFSNAYSQEQQKLAQSGMKFLSANMDARSSGMSDAFTSIEGTASSMFFNPSAVGRQQNLVSVAVGHMTYIADIKYYFAGIALAPEQGAYGVFGVTLQGVNYGDIMGTVVANNEQGFLETGIYSPYAFAIGLNYAVALSEKFQIGGGVKYVDQYLGPTYGSVQNENLVSKDSKKSVLAFDFGLIYKTGYKSLDFGMCVRNFSGEIKYEKEQFQTPLTFKIGLSMNMFDLLENMDPNEHSFLLSVDAVHYRDYSEQINIGAEYTFMNTISLRGGISSPADERSYTLGVGLKQTFSGIGVGVDYSYTPFGIFDPVHRLSVMFSL